MPIAKQLAWVIVRAISLALVIYSFSPLIACLGSGYVAYTLREHSVIVIKSDVPISESRRDTPLNRELQRNHERARTSAKLNALVFVLSLSAGAYCLKDGKALQKLLMPPIEPEEEET
jgi:hypothetical protein